MGPWKGRFTTLAGRSVLVQSVLFSIPVHESMAIGLPVWVIKAIDNKRRAFLWTGTDSAHGGQRQVFWTNVCRSKTGGELGIIAPVGRFAPRSRFGLPAPSTMASKAPT